MGATHANEQTLRRHLADAARLLARAGLIVATDGNLSARLGSDRLLVTPSGVRKERLTPQALLLCDARGRPLAAETNGPRPSSELPMHLAIYARRLDVMAIVHAHPKAVVALSLTGGEIAVQALPEALIGIGRVRSAAYAMPGSETLAQQVGEAAAQAEAIVLERHGAVTLGASVEEALWRMERLAWAAEVSAMARLLNAGETPAALPFAELLRLRTAPR